MKSRFSKSSAPSASGLAAENVVAGITITHPDRLVFPEDGLTKLGLALYYEAVAEWMLPHVRNRLLSLVRCPDGIAKTCFFQKHPGRFADGALRHVEVEEKDETDDYVAVDDVRGIISLVQMGVIEFHGWGSQADNFEKPDRIIFDLDPDSDLDWADVVTAARQVKLILDELGLESFVKTTGGKGLHVVVPIQRRTTWDDVKSFARGVAQLLVDAAPERYVATSSKAARTSKIFVDYLRNDRGATSVAPYSVRAKSGAPVSMPVHWHELANLTGSAEFTVANALARLQNQKTDPWAGLLTTRQTLSASIMKRIARVNE